ncbi:MAG: hypothetical protein K2H09_05235 [Treponemataceae bacterium]|nr:hypothetical protein [Treponemataceae bacterium]
MADKVEPYELSAYNKEAQMEFIGYKADGSSLSSTAEIKLVNDAFSRGGKKLFVGASPLDQWKSIVKTSGIRDVGKLLQDRNIAIDKSFAYFGIYSLQELELYKSQYRYVTFVEVAENKFVYKDNGYSKQMWGIAGGSLLSSGAILTILGIALPAESESDASFKKVCTGFGIGLDAAGLISSCVALAPSKTKGTFVGLYNVYVYDTKTKEIIRKDAVSVLSEDTFKGSYNHGSESQSVVLEYYSKIIANAILAKYDEINRWLSARN